MTPPQELQDQTRNMALLIDGDNAQASLIANILAETASQDDDWAYLSVVGKCVHDLEPAFDPRTFNHKKLTSLIASRPDLFETRALKKDSHDRPLTEVRLAP